jgi:hypothetical protein
LEAYLLREKRDRSRQQSTILEPSPVAEGVRVLGEIADSAIHQQTHPGLLDELKFRARPHLFALEDTVLAGLNVVGVIMIAIIVHSSLSWLSKILAHAGPWAGKTLEITELIVLTSLCMLACLDVVLKLLKAAAEVPDTVRGYRATRPTRYGREGGDTRESDCA